MKKETRKVFGRNEIAEHIAHVEGISRDQAARIVKTTVNAIILGLSRGFIINLNGLMRLRGVYIAPRQGFHPLDRCPKELPASVRVRATFSSSITKLLKSRVDLFERLKKGEETLPDASEVVKEDAVSPLFVDTWNETASE